MQKLILLYLFTTIIFAKNPIVYAALGDVIYNNADKIEKLHEIDEFNIYDDKINQYVQKVNNAKKEGFKIEQGDKSIDKKEYLTTLRALSKENDFFLRESKRMYEGSLKNENSKLFSQLINSGLIDVEENKQEIIDYYFIHQEDINASGVIENILEEDAALKVRKEAELRKTKSKQERELEKIKRIREKDKREQEALEQKLQKELEDKKKQLRQEQKEELLKTR
ncbi:hypothetical protein [Sulfurimonas sp. C5]|uniref:hypothetical protein n=1 Tax=Sulfurimonas sp. C5 TaxID=3036947 RepID=UPI002458906F|nr:hypothetical protein [Sulfurimonas sp. C5]MDH4944650.1 hypothetical protein [Sulfurimonas sp. C5]